MKVTTEKQLITVIEPEKGDTLSDLWNAMGAAEGGGWPVSITDGKIVAVQPIPLRG